MVVRGGPRRRDECWGVLGKRDEQGVGRMKKASRGLSAVVIDGVSLYGWWYLWRDGYWGV